MPDEIKRKDDQCTTAFRSVGTLKGKSFREARWSDYQSFPVEKLQSVLMFF
jgi:hypothetical protein